MTKAAIANANAGESAKREGEAQREAQRYG